MFELTQSIVLFVITYLIHDYIHRSTIANLAVTAYYSQKTQNDFFSDLSGEKGNDLYIAEEHPHNQAFSSHPSNVVSPTSLPIKPLSSRLDARCALISRDGLIILISMGRTANKLFEYSFATALADTLCWPVWEFNKERLSKPSIHDCFPKAIPETAPTNFSYLGESIESNLSLAYKESFSDGNGHLVARMKHWDEYFFCWHMDCDYELEPWEVASGILNGTSKVKVIILRAFFIHYDWMRPRMDLLRESSEINPECCHAYPEPNALVFHIRNFVRGDWMYLHVVNITVNVYLEIAEHYNLTGRPTYVVCQPEDVQSKPVQDIVTQFSAKVYPGLTPYDAHCFIRSANFLILSEASSFSQIAAVMNPNAQVHYPFTSLDSPPVTLKVDDQNWKYHLINKTRTGIQKFDDISRLKVRQS